MLVCKWNALSQAAYCRHENKKQHFFLLGGMFSLTVIHAAMTVENDSRLLAVVVVCWFEFKANNVGKLDVWRKDETNYCGWDKREHDGAAPMCHDTASMWEMLCISVVPSSFCETLETLKQGCQWLKLIYLSWIIFSYWSFVPVARGGLFLWSTTMHIVRV